jgi:hypothetical protein
MQNVKLQLKIKNFEVESGNVLLLALLVMAGIMTAGLAIGSIILNEIKQARNIDFASVAYFAAESGVEQALYKFRREDAVITCPAGTCDTNGFCTLGDNEPCIGSRGNLSNQSFWTRTVTDKELQIYGKIKKDESLQVDLFDPEGAAAAGVESIKIAWTPECVSPAASMIEVAYIAWDPAVGWISDSEQRFKYSAVASPAINNGFSSVKSYRVRIKALYCDISNLIVTALANNDAVAPEVQIPARVVLNSIGNFSNLRQAIKMTMPRRSPMSGLYDYVLFSECSLVKGEEAACL